MTSLCGDVIIASAPPWTFFASSRGRSSGQPAVIEKMTMICRIHEFQFDAAILTPDKEKPEEW
jgi:hypothetical protein